MNFPQYRMLINEKVIYKIIQEFNQKLKFKRKTAKVLVEKNQIKILLPKIKMFKLSNHRTKLN